MRRAVAGYLTLLAVARGVPAASAADADGAAVATPPPASGQAATPTRIRIDGAFDDWPAGTYLAADGRWLHVRLSLPEARNIQASDLPLVVAIDARADGAFDPDLRLTFSPPATGGLGIAVSAVQHGDDDAKLGHA